MHTAPPPDDVTRLLRAHGARPAAAVGTDGSWWVGRPVDDADGPWLEVLVADVPVDATLSARAGLLTSVEHPHLARVLAVEPLGPARVALVCEHVPGPTLAAVRAARPPLADGEVVTVAVPVAQGLAALHAAGLAHGAVGADRVVLRPGGVPVLVDLRGALRGAGTPTGDVHRLVATLLGLMPPLDAHIAAGLEDAVRLRDALEGLLRAPAAPEQVVDTVFAVASPLPVTVPDADELAAADVALATGRSGLPRAAAPPVDPPRRARRERAPRRWPVVAAVAGALVVGVAAVALRGALGGAGPAQAGAGTAAVTQPAASPGASQEDVDRAALLDRDAPAAAAAALTRLRVAALAEPDAAGVAALEVPGSPAARADAALVEQLAGARSEGLTAHVRSAELVGPEQGDEVVVEVTSALSAHERVTPQGDRAPVPGTGERTVRLVLRWTPDGWRVQDVRQ